MTRKSRRRRGSDQEHRDAASEHPHDSTARPTREQAFEAFCVLLAFAAGHSASPSVFTQDDLPPDCSSRGAYIARHRQLRAAGVDGVWVRGKTLACTPAAWSHELPRAPRLTVVESTRDIDAELDAALGIRPRAAR